MMEKVGLKRLGARFAFLLQCKSNIWVRSDGQSNFSGSCTNDGSLTDECICHPVWKGENCTECLAHLVKGRIWPVSRCVYTIESKVESFFFFFFFFGEFNQCSMSLLGAYLTSLRRAKQQNRPFCLLDKFARRANSSIKLETLLASLNAPLALYP
jgi:hypothetical protein